MPFNGDWIVSGSGTWGTAANWHNSNIPNATGAFATFGIASTSGAAGTRTIDLGGVNRTVGFLNIEGDSDTWWNLSNGTLVFDVFGGSAFVFDVSTPSGSSFNFNTISATIQLNDNIVFNSAAGATMEVSGSITESGGSRTLDKQNAGTLILSGANSYSGVTTITAGTLQIGSGGSTGTLGSNFSVVNNATLEYKRGNAFTENHDISGTGDVIFSGQGGVATITGNNSYLGSTSITTGTVKFGKDDAFGASTEIVVTGVGVLDLNGFNQNTGFTSLTGTGTVNNTSGFSSILNLNISGAVTFDGNIVGNNLRLDKSGAGTFTLTSGNSYTSNTYILEGTLALSGPVGSISNSRIIIEDGATFDISGTTTSGGSTIKDIEAVAGGFIVLGGKTLTIAQASQFAIPGAAPTIVGLAAVADNLVVKLAVSSIDMTSTSFLNWGEANDLTTIIGTNGNDTITGTAFNDLILADNNLIGTGNDTLNGGNGNDTLVGGSGDDTMNGGFGTDTASYDLANLTGGGGVTVNLTTVGAQNTFNFGIDTLVGIENVTGSRFNDNITGDSLNNVLKGLADTDNIDGLAGDDTIEGGAGNDDMDGGSNTAAGDTLSYETSDAAVTVNIGANTASGGHATGDTIVNFENVTGSIHDDFLTGSNGNNVLKGGLGNDSLTGGLGNDTADWALATGAIVFTLGVGGTGVTANVAGIGIDTLSGMENLISGAGIDVLTGNSDNNALKGNGNTDTLNGEGGDDNLNGGAANDTLNGGAGLDTLLGGAGLDTLNGGADADTLRGEGSNDTMNGDGGDDSLFGGSGNDTMNGGIGNDTLEGQGNNDTIHGNEDNDTIRGAEGLDTLFGDAGDDNINGGAGADIIDGGTGNDIMTGTLDLVSDKFVFGLNYDLDRVNSFEQGIDDLRLDDALWGGGLSAAQVVTNFGTINGSNTLITLNFGNGDVLELLNGAGLNLATLSSDIVII